MDHVTRRLLADSIEVLDAAAKLPMRPEVAYALGFVRQAIKLALVVPTPPAEVRP